MREREPNPYEPDDAPPEQCVIWSGEHRAYWRPNSAGYTTRLEEAGIYDRTKAESIAAGCGPDKRIKVPACPACADRKEIV